MVLKSSEKALLTSFYVARLVQEAGFPPGMFNVLSGFGHPCGNALALHPCIRKISFTGSIRGGKAVQEAAARSNLKKVSLELGGKSPIVVFPDAISAKLLQQPVPRYCSILAKPASPVPAYIFTRTLRRPFARNSSRKSERRGLIRSRAMIC